MNRTLNLNTVKRPTFELTLMDENETVLHVRVPSLNMFRELQGLAEGLGSLDEHDKDTVDTIYEFLARALSHNREGIRITADELPTKYNVDLELMVLVFREYVNFLTDLANEKN